MRDPVYASELAHDTAGVDPTPFMQAALDNVVERLMSGGKVPGLGWRLNDFIGGQVDAGELVSAALITNDFAALRAEIERRLKRELEDADVTHDLAAELANARDDE